MRLLLGSLILALLSASAWAHPGHDHGGLLAGLLHPLTGLDHLLIAAGLGFWASQQHQQLPSALLLAGFLAGVALGYCFGLMGIGAVLGHALLLPALLGLGILLVLARPAPAGALLLAVPLVGLLHGQAHGLAAVSGSAMAFGTGMLLASAAVFAAGHAGARLVAARGGYCSVARGAGAAMLLVALAPVVMTLVAV